MSNNIDELKEAEKQADESAFDGGETPAYSSHRSRTRGKNWGAGLILIAVGTIFLLSNTMGVTLHNWWALFILIPAFSNFGNMYRQYQENGRFTRSARGSLTGGLLLTLVASIFLFNLDWGFMWPFFLIILGVSALIGSQLD